MITITPSAQLAIADSSLLPSSVGAVSPAGAPIICQNGWLVQDSILAPGSSGIALAFPLGVTTAQVIYLLPLTATDLMVNLGAPSPLPLPMGQPMFLYGLTSIQISLSSVLGGKIQYGIGG
jgi:hypothetical protein